jgi:hypothetical protein
MSADRRVNDPMDQAQGLGQDQRDEQRRARHASK